ncbi:MAG TPA: hypothetical protein VFF08_01715 [Trueperaceae bacterium]|nr:hypothetical protein [Trueperaceae bacterium]
MRRLLLAALLALLATAAAQSPAALSGIVKSEQPLAAGTRVAIHVVDADNVWGFEVASVEPVGGTFSVTPAEVPASEMRPFRSGAVILPGLQNEYRITPEGVNVAVARFNMYVDDNSNGVFDRVQDKFYVGVAQLEDPIGFFTLLYVDRPATLTGGGVELEFQPGWNVFTVRFPEERPEFSVVTAVDDIVLDVILP